MMRRSVDLFSGIGGFSLAAHWAGFTTQVFCERDPFCQTVLRKHWPSVPIISDIREFDGTQYKGAELLTGGFPCQPFSVAGKRLGNQDYRFLWPEMLRVIREVKPTWIVGENVAGIINMELDGVLSDLENEGYATQAFVLPACAVNAPHKRNRVWMVGYSKHDGSSSSEKSSISIKTSKYHSQGKEKTFQFTRTSRSNHSIYLENKYNSEFARWKRKESSESRMGDMAHGLPARLVGHFDTEPDIPRTEIGIQQRIEKLKALGNSIVPEVAYQILRYI